MIAHKTVMDMLCITNDIYNKPNENNSVFAQADIVVHENEKRICVVFRGTKCAMDWNHNLQFLQHSIKDKISVHKGFCKHLFATNLYTRVYSSLCESLIHYPDYELFITGHSSGGAFATLFGYLISLEITEKQINVVTFASPRIGNLAFKRDFEKRANLKHWRVTNKNDFIPHVPYFFYHHVGNKIYIRTLGFTCCFKEYCNHLFVSYEKSLKDTVW